MVITESFPTMLTSTIALSGSLAASVDLEGKTLLGIIMPSAWTAASLTFSVSADNTTFVDLYDSSVEVSVAAGINRFIRLNPNDWVGIRYIKVRSGTTAVPVTQAAARAILLVTKAV